MARPGWAIRLGQRAGSMPLAAMNTVAGPAATTRPSAAAMKHDSPWPIVRSAGLGPDGAGPERRRAGGAQDDPGAAGAGQGVSPAPSSARYSRNSGAGES